MEAIKRREFLGGLAAVICAPYVVRNSGILMPIADRSLVTYEVRGEQLAKGGGPLADPYWLQVMRFEVPRKTVNFRIPHVLLAAAKRVRPEVYWTNLVIAS